MKILQDYVVPYIREVEENGRINAAALHGTAFFINSRGVFVTARLVVENCSVDLAEHGGTPALSVRKPGEDQHRYSGEIGVPPV